MNLEKIKEELIRLSQLYYDGEPEVTDQEFDSLYKEYLSNGGEPLGVAFGYQPVGEKTKHLVSPVGSLDKTNIETLDKSFADDDLIELTMKLDGNTGVIYYDHGKLIKGVSRGDGIEGIDITRNIIHSVPKTIPIKTPTAVRGEIVLSWKDFEKTGGSHPRNKASGLSQSLKVDPKEVQLLKFAAYNIMTLSAPRDMIMDTLKEWGFTTPPSALYKFSHLKKMLKEDHPYLCNEDSNFFKIDGEKIPYDGLVFCLEGSRCLINENVKGWKHYQNKAVAFKFKDESAFTTITNIEWNLSETGRMVPLGHVEPVVIEGANISKVTLNNYEWLENREIGIGSKVEIIRANMVIPKVINVVTPSLDRNIPKVCPKCGKTLVRDGVDLKCTYSECSNIEDGLIWRIITTFVPKGLAEATITDFINKFNIKNLLDLKNVISDIKTPELISSNWGVGYGSLLAEFIDRIRNNKPTIKDVLLIAKLPSLGNTFSTEIDKNCSNEDFINYVEKEDMSNLTKYCGNYVARDGLLNSVPVLKRLVKFFNYELKEKEETKQNMNTTGKAAITGKLSMTKKEMEKVLNSLGYELVRAEKGADLLVWDGKRESSQYKTAQKKGIEILTENEFRSKFNLV